MREAIVKVYRTLRDTREGGYSCKSVGATTSLSSVHEVFHVSMLRKYTPDPTHVVDWGDITVVRPKKIQIFGKWAKW